MPELILKMSGISKSFPGVNALKNVCFDLYSGEVHALVGENGAGKSTLMKILTGIYQRDEGYIEYFGEALQLRNTREAIDKGICIIHQELSVMNELTVAQNLFIGREKKKGIFLDEKAINKETVRILGQLGMEIDPEEQMGNLTVGKQQMVEIAKAVSLDSKLLVLDEPTTALAGAETDHLFEVIRRLQENGVGMIYISHRMDEIAKISGRITVLRDGEYVGTVDTKESTHDQIVKMMVGRTIYHEPKQRRNFSSDAPVALEVKNLNAGRKVQEISFKLYKGEILCFTGLMGSGRTEVARALFGADPKTSGEIIVEGKKRTIKSPSDAVEAGIGYLSEDRKRFGLCLGLTVSENLTLTNLNKYSGHLFVRQKEVNNISQKYIGRLNIKTPSIRQVVRYLSGGNQQKVIVAKWLIKNSDILIFDEPTRGIDVGSKSEIYELIHELVDEGKSVIVISSELPEVMRLADRIIVMCEGKITGEVGLDASREKIMSLAHQLNA